MTILITMAWRPLLDPVHIEAYWMVLMLPLVVAVSVVYKTIKLPDLTHLPIQVTRLSLQILVFFILAAAALWLLTELV